MEIFAGRPNSKPPPRITPNDAGNHSKTPNAHPPDTALRVDPKSKLAGYSFETSKGRYVTVFWQNESIRSSREVNAIDLYPSGIFSSTFLKTGSSWKPSGRTLVATNTKPDTPLAAISWSNGIKAALYYLNERNNLCERLTGDGGITWYSGSLTDLLVPARNNSSLGAVVIWETLEEFEIHVYFQDERNKIRNLQYSGKDKRWFEDHPSNIESLKAVSGTSIATVYDSVYTMKRFVYTQTEEMAVREFIYEKSNNKWHVDRNGFPKPQFNRYIHLGSSIDRWTSRFFVYDGNRVIEQTWRRGPNCRWLEVKTLPTREGTSEIKQNFIVLHWPLDERCTGSEIHLFSLDSSHGVLWDYLVGPGTGLAVSLVRAEDVSV